MVNKVIKVRIAISESESDRLAEKRCSMKNILKSIPILLLLLFSTCYAQDDWEELNLNPLSDAVGTEVDFLENRPVIDGSLDENLKKLPVRPFCMGIKSPGSKVAPIHFRLAYGTSFLYVYIEADAEKMTYRDRAYQNGDGFVVTIAKPKPDNEPADEFYDLACSAVQDPMLEWTRRIFWYLNVTRIFIRPSADTQHLFKEENGKICFEVLLPWKDVRPYHPWLSDQIGFNIRFTKAAENEERIVYQIVDTDGRPNTKRSYIPIKFQKPVLKGVPQTFVNFINGHITESEPISAQIVTLAKNKGKCEIRFALNRENEQSRDLFSAAVDYQKGLNITCVRIAMTVKPNPDYTIMYRSSANHTVGESQSLIVFPKYNKEEMNTILMKSESVMAKSSIYTIQFLTDEVDKKISLLKDYEINTSDYQSLAATLNYLDSAKAGNDQLMNMTGFIRKAYKSKLDHTLQPYVVYLPDNFDKTKKYPLFVFLHGSESTEMNIQRFSKLIPEGFIALGPLGRGTSNGFAIDHAQDDIAEAIEAVVKDYPIDDRSILIAGFSMGGYGVYRSYFETPKKYKGIAIFSGHPNYGGLNNLPIPDFTDEKNLAVFKDVPIFIFHGKTDRNAPFDITNGVYEKLKKIGADVLAVYEEEGHREPSDETNRKYYEWVKRIFNNESIK